MEVPQKTKNRTITQPSNSISRFLDKETKTLIQNNICTPIFTAALFTIAKYKCNLKLDKENVIYNIYIYI